MSFTNVTLTGKIFGLFQFFFNCGVAFRTGSDVLHGIVLFPVAGSDATSTPLAN